jgi:hypothetical protein
MHTSKHGAPGVCATIFNLTGRSIQYEHDEFRFKPWLHLYIIVQK